MGWNFSMSLSSWRVKLLSASTMRNADMFTKLYLKSSKSNVSKSFFWGFFFSCPDSRKNKKQKKESWQLKLKENNTSSPTHTSCGLNWLTNCTVTRYTCIDGRVQLPARRRGSDTGSRSSAIGEPGWGLVDGGGERGVNGCDSWRQTTTTRTQIIVGDKPKRKKRKKTMNCNDGLSFTYWCVSIHLCLEDYTAKETRKSNSFLFCFSSRIYTRFKERESHYPCQDLFIHYELSCRVLFSFIFGSGEEKLVLHTMESTTCKLERDSNIHRRGISALIKSRMWESLLRRSRIFLTLKKGKSENLWPVIFHISRLLYPGCYKDHGK
jgi:hypothetical protein